MHFQCIFLSLVTSSAGSRRPMATLPALLCARASAAKVFREYPP
jgi:hypothetical protein